MNVQTSCQIKMPTKCLLKKIIYFLRRGQFFILLSADSHGVMVCVGVYSGRVTYLSKYKVNITNNKF